MSDDQGDDQVVGTISVESGEDGKFYYSLEDKQPVGPFDDEEQATQAAIDFLQAAITRLVKQSLGV